MNEDENVQEIARLIKLVKEVKLSLASDKIQKLVEEKKEQYLSAVKIGMDLDKQQYIDGIIRGLQISLNVIKECE